ncbi:unnamed protein product [Dibothriocephalus latus]|uniref:Uncharacterized protein n=1 Tax=Dibothriocephalus latus TaxID=60516 RepID=A0A3P7QM49_DIBLA|nr:unnamed protein product [Dibothriocephalus latus]
MIYKVIACSEIPEIAQYFKMAVDMPTRELCFKLVVQRTDGLPHIYRLSRRAVNAWNNLLSDVVAADTFAVFEKKYDTLFEQ